MILLCTILFIVLLSFGIFRQSVLYPNEAWNWTLVKNVVYKPYFMLYGELYAEEIDTCGDYGTNCVSYGWLTPLFMTIYLLLAIKENCSTYPMYVACEGCVSSFSFVFNTVSTHSHLIWKFHKYQQVMDYEQQPFLPPPLVIIVHIYRLVRYTFLRTWRAKKTQLFLSDADLSKLHDFESQCLEDLLTKKRNETAIKFGNLIVRVEYTSAEEDHSV
ncbi:unnamed protein product [Soboliphyme baturini]|uniref:Transmembrane protein n=1 Tax=Soboliphyme baturini TaxID=241478 RepID=A0A183J9Q4_9BILA|nr:unnamed protein product [Soboliphyme baturini]